MISMTHTHPNAMWRSDLSRLRSRELTCSTVIGNVYGSKPATEVSAFGAFRPTRRGVPPQ